jgi:hypothetical protein
MDEDDFDEDPDGNTNTKAKHHSVKITKSYRLSATTGLSTLYLTSVNT